MNQLSGCARHAKRSLAAAAGLTLLAVTTGGCANGPEGAFSGAALGAAGGAIIGSVFGAPGAGAAIGASSGALAGGVIGDQNARRDRRAYVRPTPPRVIERHYYYDAPPPDPYHARDRYRRRHGGG
ncbi:MAG: hypothetical protein D6693_03430 [Planctomycetota bacterium]|nr:MAG: hypothetical protein D6693_03430 [Planctomycetota bacterium]